MNQSIQSLADILAWPHFTQNYRQAMESGDSARFELALTLADEEYNHLECETVKAQSGQRSFCLHHSKITDTAVLVIHGWTACPFEMKELGEILFHQGYNVYGVRLAGHGTQVADFEKYGLDDWENSVQKGLGIASLLGKKVIVIGESMGGALATILAATFPELISKIILCAPCFQFADWKAQFTVFGLVRKSIPEVDFGVLPDWQKDYWYSKIPVSGVMELVKVARKARNMGPDIQVSTLIIQAQNDKMVNYHGAERFYKSLTKLAKYEKLLILFLEGHHNLTIDLNPNKTQVFQWVTEFINQQDKVTGNRQ